MAMQELTVSQRYRNRLMKPVKRLRRSSRRIETETELVIDCSTDLAITVDNLTIYIT
ncbi:hypothetical protein CHS0354_033550, partial [Potamilus streckersoni]